VTDLEEDTVLLLALVLGNSRRLIALILFHWLGKLTNQKQHAVTKSIYLGKLLLHIQLTCIDSNSSRFTLCLPLIPSML
jgi:hypothetical protein